MAQPPSNTRKTTPLPPFVVREDAEPRILPPLIAPAFGAAAAAGAARLGAPSLPPAQIPLAEISPLDRVYNMGAGGRAVPRIPGAPVRPLLPPGIPGAPTSGPVYSMPPIGGASGSTPGAAVVPRTVGSVPKRIPTGVGPYTGTGGAAGGGAAAGGEAAGAARLGLRGLARGAALAGATALSIDELRQANADPNSDLNRRINAAQGEMALARQREASTGEKAGIAVRNAALGGYEAAAAGLSWANPMNFIRGLFGMEPAREKTAAEYRPAATLVAPQSAVAQAAQMQGAAQGTRTPDMWDAPLRLNQILPVLQLMPRQTAAPPTGKDAVYEDIRDMMRTRMEAIQNSPISDEQKSRLIDREYEKLAALLGSNSMMMPDLYDNEQ